MNILKTLSSHPIATPLGDMIAIADENVLHLIKFSDQAGLQQEIAKLCAAQKATLSTGRPAPLDLVEKELAAYFARTLTTFTTPLQLAGTPFQQQAWTVLQRVPYGQTKSYAQQAQAIGNPSAFRAVANANRVNRFAIIIPCHRIILSSGQLCGYNGGVERKKWLLEHEKRSC